MTTKRKLKTKIQTLATELARRVEGSGGYKSTERRLAKVQAIYQAKMAEIKAAKDTKRATTVNVPAHNNQEAP